MHRKRQKGKFIVFEGIDGSGISTQTQRIKALLKSKYDIKAVLAKEPSEGPIGTIIRQVLSDRILGIDDSCLALLFAADRIDHNINKIKPVIEQGDLIICDRYLWSTYAYQGIYNDYAWIKEINKFAYKPDLTIFIKVQPETSLKRIIQGRFKTEKFEKVDVLGQVLANYIKLIKEWKDLGEPVVEINGEQDPTFVEKDIMTVIEHYFLNKNTQLPLGLG
jgi:dTMP kinase